MKKIDYQKVMDAELEAVSALSARPSLLLHACCAPCSSYVLEYLNEYFDITVYFYNPNISPREEYEWRAEELRRFVEQIAKQNNIKTVFADYNSDDFYNTISGVENTAEGGERCRRCYELRLESTARYASEKGFDYFCTTLSISPYKNCVWLNEIGEGLARKYGIKYLLSDFKKKNGYKRSCELSEQYGLYRQNYCGCEFSKREAEKRAEKRK
ncbi:MAG: epoxyqueuosine reductase QueH [Clostridia bacterium]|nr:epoxyqueuosine reductase QueH [Clostridia bacterium]